MIFLATALGPLLLIAGLALRGDPREAALPLLAGILLTLAGLISFDWVLKAGQAVLWMVTPGVAGVLLLVNAIRTRLGSAAQGAYAAIGLLAIVPTLFFTFIFFALSGDA